MKKLFSIVIVCALFLAGCSEFSGDQYVFYGTVQHTKERIKSIDISNNTYSNVYDSGTIYSINTGIAGNANTTFSSTGTQQIQPVRECIYTIRLRDGNIVTITQENGPTVRPNQKVAVHYYPSGVREVIPVDHNPLTGKQQIKVPYDVEKNKMIIEVW